MWDFRLVEAQDGVWHEEEAALLLRAIPGGFVATITKDAGLTGAAELVCVWMGFD